MSEPKAHVEIIHGDDYEWPEPVKRRLDDLAEVANNNDFSILCVVGLNHKSKHISTVFSAKSSGNPHLVEMLDDIVEMFTQMAKRLKQ